MTIFLVTPKLIYCFPHYRRVKSTIDVCAQVQQSFEHVTFLDKYHVSFLVISYILNHCASCFTNQFLIIACRHLQLSVPSQDSCNGFYPSWHLKQNLLNQTCHSHWLRDPVPPFGRTYLSQKKKKHLWVYQSNRHTALHFLPKFSQQSIFYYPWRTFCIWSGCLYWEFGT